MYCVKCGQPIEDGSKFCTFCGAPARQAAAPGQTAQAAPQQTAGNGQAAQAAPQPAASEPAVSNQPVYNAALQPDASVAAPVRRTARRDGTGRYILKRLIFFAAALVIGIILSIVLMSGVQAASGLNAPNVSADMIISRIGSTLVLIIVPLIIAFAGGLLSGLARSNAAKNVIRIIAAILRSLVPFALGGYAILYLFGFAWRILPIYGTGEGSSYVIPLLILTVPLAGFFMNAAADNGRRPGFAGGISAVAAFAADKMPVIVLAEMIVEIIFSVPGISTLTINMIMSRAGKISVVMILYTVIIYVLKLLFDIIAALTARGDPAPCGYMTARSSKSGRGLLIAGLILAALMVILAVVLPFTASGSPYAMDLSSHLLMPGEGGTLLGTDTFGRDYYTQLVYALRNTMFVAAVNTVVCVILGIGFGVLMGFLKGAAADVFKGITYVFGHGTSFALMLSVLTISLGVTPFFIVGLFGWGSIAERVAGAIKSKKAAPASTGIIIVPALRAVVQIFCSAVIWISGITILGLGISTPSFPTIGYLLMSHTSYLSRYPHLIMWPAAALTILLVCFYVLDAGLAARERRSE